MIRTLYPLLSQATDILDGVMTLQQWKRLHPLRMQKNGQDITVYYRFYDPYWFAVAITPENAEYQARQGWKHPFHRLEGVVWC